MAGLQYLKQVDKLTNERLQEKMNQGIGAGMEQIAISHSLGVSQLLPFEAHHEDADFRILSPHLKCP